MSNWQIYYVSFKPQKRLFITAVRGVNKQFVIQYFCDIIAAEVTEKYCNDLNDAMSSQHRPCAMLTKVIMRGIIITMIISSGGDDEMRTH